MVHASSSHAASPAAMARAASSTGHGIGRSAMDGAAIVVDALLIVVVLLALLFERLFLVPPHHGQKFRPGPLPGATPKARGTGRDSGRGGR